MTDKRGRERQERDTLRSACCGGVRSLQKAAAPRGVQLQRLNGSLSPAAHWLHSAPPVAGGGSAARKETGAEPQGKLTSGGGSLSVGLSVVLFVRLSVCRSISL